MRQHQSDSIQEVVSRSYDAAGGLKNVSNHTKLALSTLSEHTEFPRKTKQAGGLGINYVDTLCRGSAPAAAVYAAHFAELAGGVFQPVASGPCKASLTEQSGAVAIETAQAVSATLRASDSANARDYQEAEREIDEAVAALLDAKAILRVKRGAGHVSDNTVQLRGKVG